MLHFDPKTKQLTESGTGVLTTPVIVSGHPKMRCVLYEPAVSSENSRIGIVLIHSDEDYSDFPIAGALAERGYRCLAGQVSDPNGPLEKKLLDVKHAAEFLKSLPGVEKLVLLGHSGMRNARMFDDLRQLEAGDKFVIWTLNEPYAYEVFRKEVVLPDEAERKMGLVQGQDLVTLVTCTPYGVNSHRLLVQARRCAYDAGEMGDVGLSAYVNGRTMPLAVPLAALVVLGVASVVARGAGKRRKARKSAGERMVNGTSCEADDFGVKNE